MTPDYREWIREQRCCECNARPPSEAHHPTMGRGMGQKSDDGTCFPLCTKCHMDFHDMRGAFKDGTKAVRRAWQERMSGKYQMLYRAKFAQPST